MKILIVEDEKSLLEAMVAYMANEGYTCETASEFVSASDKISSHTYDCMVVDLTIPNGSGLQLIEEFNRKSPSAAVIIISARNSLHDKINGFQTGSDDYLTKPFHLPELNIRIQTILRRKQFDGNKWISFNEIKVDTVSRRAYVNDKELSLTLKEYNLLTYFLVNKNRVLSKSAIVEHLWQDNIDQSDTYNFLYTHIKNLRRKLIELGSKDYIQTVYGMGYNFKLA